MSPEITDKPDPPKDSAIGNAAPILAALLANLRDPFNEISDKHLEELAAFALRAARALEKQAEVKPLPAT